MLQDAEIGGVIINIRDVSESRKAAELLKLKERNKLLKPRLINLLFHVKTRWQLCYPYAKGHAVEEIYSLKRLRMTVIKF
jgi:hypothetical protein